MATGGPLACGVVGARECEAPKRGLFGGNEGESPIEQTPAKAFALADELSRFCWVITT